MRWSSLELQCKRLWLTSRSFGRARAGEIARSYTPEESLSVFETGKEQARDAYFLHSGDKVRCFVEEDAVVDGKLVMDPEISINKIGHNLHQLDPVFREMSFSDHLRGVYRSLGFRRPTVVQSMYIFKNARIGGAVTPHQDSTFLYTDPPSCVGAWWALGDCTRDNGCLWAVPGSHSIPITRRFVRDAAGTRTFFEPAEPVQLPTEGAVPLECPAGTLVLLHGAVVHFSEANRSGLSRPAYSIHVVETADRPWLADNWLQRSDDSGDFEALFEAAAACA